MVGRNVLMKTLLSVSVALPLASLGRDLVWLGSLSDTRWDMTTANWFVKGDATRTRTCFEPGDNVWFLESEWLTPTATMIRTDPNKHQYEFDVGAVVISNDTATFTWSANSGMWVAACGDIRSVDKFGKGSVTVGVLSEWKGDYTIHEGSFLSMRGSYYICDYRGEMGSMHDPRTVRFMPGTTWSVGNATGFGGAGNGTEFEVQFLGATLEVAKQNGYVNLGKATFADTEIRMADSSRPEDAFIFAGDVRITGRKPIVIPSARTMMFGRQNGKEVVVDVEDVTRDDEADFIVSNRLCNCDFTNGNTYRGYCNFRKVGEGTMTLACAEGHTSTGTVTVAEGILRVDGNIPTGTVKAEEGGLLAGTGIVANVMIGDGGGFAVYPNARGGELLNVRTLDSQGNVLVRLVGSTGGRELLDGREVVRLIDRPATFDLSNWCATTTGEPLTKGVSFTYDPSTGIITIHAQAVESDVPCRGESSYYDVEWARDTVTNTRDGVWVCPATCSYSLEAGTLGVEATREEPMRFVPKEYRAASPRATFEMRAEMPLCATEDLTSAEASAGLCVTLDDDGSSFAYAGIVEGEWRRLRGKVPVKEGRAFRAKVRFEVDESRVPSRVSYLVDDVRLHDEDGDEWLRIASKEKIRGEIMLNGNGGIGDVHATSGDPATELAVRDEQGRWEYHGTNDIAALRAAGKQMYLVMPPKFGVGTIHETGVRIADLPADEIGIWPSEGMMTTAFATNGHWYVFAERIPGKDVPIVTHCQLRSFIAELPTATLSGTLKVKGDAYYDITQHGGELVILTPQPTTPRGIYVSTNTVLTLKGALGSDPLAIELAVGGVLNANALAGGLAVNAIDVNCGSGFGSAENIRLTAEGTLNVKEPNAAISTGRIPIDFSAAIDSMNVTNWTFLADGEMSDIGEKCRYDEGTISIDQRCRDEAWRCLPIWGGGYIMNVVHTSDPNILYSYADVCGPFRSDDAGKTWQRIGENLSLGMRRFKMAQVRTLSVDPRDPHSVVAAAGDSGIDNPGGFMVSRNGGKSWRTTRWTTFKANGINRAKGALLVRDPNNPDRLLGGEEPHGVFLSEDNGETWTCMDIPGEHLLCIHWDRAVAGRAYVSVETNGLWRSENHGKSWQWISPVCIDEMTQIAGDTRVLGIVGRHHVVASVDGGLTWENFEGGLEVAAEQPSSHGEKLAYNALASGKDFWLAGNGNGDVYRRQIKAKSWSKLAKPTFSTSDPEHEVFEQYRVNKGNAKMDALCTISIDPRNENRWFITDWYTIWETVDAGASYIARNLGISQLCSQVFTVDPLDANYLAYGLHDMILFVSTNAASSFFMPSIRAKIYGGNSHVTLPSFEYSPRKPGLAMAASYVMYGGYGIARSYDHGATWSYPECKGLAPRVYMTNAVNNVSFRPDRDEVWACVGGDVGEGRGGPYCSTDDGNTWVWKGKGIAAGGMYYVEGRSGRVVRPLVFSADGSGVTIAGSLTSAYFWSEDTQEWTKSDLAIPLYGYSARSLVTDPFVPGRFLLGGPSGINESLDGGRTWHAFAGYSGRSDMLAFDANEKGLLVIACADGIRISWNGGESFELAPYGFLFDSGNVWGNLVDMQVDRRRLFVATGSGGVFQRNLVPQPGLMLLIVDVGLKNLWYNTRQKENNVCRGY